MSNLKFAFRSLAKSPGFTGVAVLSLAFGIGSCTAIFSVANAILLRSLPVPNPQQLRIIQWTGIDCQVPSLAEHPVSDGNRSTAYSFSYPMYQALRERAGALADVFGYIPIEDVVVRARDDVFTANGQMVSDNFFSGLEIRPRIGLLFGTQDAASDLASSVVITYEFWERHFALDPDVLGKSVTLNGVASTIKGVLPRNFDGIRPGDRRDFYVPMSARTQFFKESFQTFSSTRHWWVRLMARTRAPHADAQLQAVLDAAFAREGGAVMKAPKILVESGQGGPSIDRDSYRRPVSLLLGIVGLVMLVACANLAGLSLARGAAREHELAVRAALGANRWFLIRLSLTESLVLALLGGGLGIFFALWGKDAVSRLLVDSTDGLHYDLSLDLTVLGFTLALTMFTALFFGLLPAMRAGRIDPLDGLKARGAMRASRLRTGRILVVSQLGLSLMLIAGAGLYVRTLVNLRRIDPGFSTDSLMTLQVNPSAAGYDGSRLIGVYSQIQESLGNLPGVRSATFVQYPLLDNQSWDGGFELPGDATKPPGGLQTHRLTVGEPFFRTMEIPILQGRPFDSGDTETAPLVVVVNDAFVRQYFLRGSPLGRKIRMLGKEWMVVGVCRDAKYENVKAPMPATTYFSFRQRPIGDTICFSLRADASPTTLPGEIRKAVAKIDPALAVSRFATEDELRDSNVNQERLLATLCGSLALLALLLAAIGLYGLVAYHVTRRTREFGVRLALGAQRTDIAKAVLGEAFVLAGLGVGLGMPAAMGATRLIQGQLYGVQSNDPWALIGSSVLILGAAAFAAWIPARRATLIAPVDALRAE
jgi:predicted permease